MIRFHDEEEYFLYKETEDEVGKIRYFVPTREVTKEEEDEYYKFFARMLTDSSK